MRSEQLLYIGIMILAVFISSISQVLLKKSAMKKYSSRLREYLNPMVIIAYGIFFMATLANVFAYRIIPLSMGAIIDATGYLYVTLFGAIIFHEKINMKKVLALGMIVVGIFLYSVL